MSYCDRDDVIQRLSAAGLAYVAEDDSSMSSSDTWEIVDSAIESAGAEIDLALWAHVALPLTSPNAWLKHRAVDLAAERLVERKGHTVPASLRSAALRSRAWLEAVRRGVLRVPGLVLPTDAHRDQVRRLGRPRVINPRKED